MTSSYVELPMRILATQLEIMAGIMNKLSESNIRVESFNLGDLVCRVEAVDNQKDGLTYYLTGITKLEEGTNV